MSLKIKTILASSLLVLAGFSAVGQTTDEYKAVKRIADSLDVKRNYDLGVLMFRNYLDFIYPLENINTFSSEISIADAPEEICRDLETNPNLVFSPNPDVIQYDERNTSYGYVPEVDYSIVEQRLNTLSINTQMAFRINETVKTYIDYYALKRRNYTLKLLAKQHLYFPLFEKHMKEFGIPEQLKYLSIVESALNPKALSHAGALGLWQFMPATGKMFGLNGNSFVDERMDPEKATIAACKYLRFLYESFDNNWELALASYNCGPGAVARAIRRSGGQRDFWAIYNYLPRETRNYVPIFTAVTYIMTYAEEHNLIQHQPEYNIESEVVYMNQNINLKDFAKKINVCYDDLVEMNPELKKGFVHYTMRNYALHIPADRIDYFLENRDEILGTSSKSVDNIVAKKINYVENTDKIYHKIKYGESLGTIAHRYGVTTAQLKTWNNIQGNVIHAGRNLVINRKTKKAVAQPQKELAKADNSPKTKSNAKIDDSEIENKAEETKVITPKAEETKKVATHYTIKKGESLNMIAKKYGTSVANLKKWNNLTSEKIHPNTSLVLDESYAITTQQESKVEVLNKVVEKKEEPKSKNNKKQHTVKQGDTLWGIANDYGISVDKIKKLNNIPKNKLKIGQKLVVG